MVEQQVAQRVQELWMPHPRTGGHHEELPKAQNDRVDIGVTLGRGMQDLTHWQVAAWLLALQVQYETPSTPVAAASQTRTAERQRAVLLMNTCPVGYQPCETMAVLGYVPQKLARGAKYDPQGYHRGVQGGVAHLAPLRCSVLC